MKKLIFIIITIILSGACRKHEVDSPQFDVVTESVTYKVGDEVVFNLSGDVNQISFYSGESLHEYAYSTASRKLRTEAVNVSFRTNVTDYTTANGQSQQLEAFVSTDYNGSGTFADVSAATWKGKEDFDQWFAIAPDNNPWGATNNFPSGVQNLIGKFEEGKPIYIGFRWIYRMPRVQYGWPRAWSIYNIDANATTLLGTSNLFNNVNVFSLVFDDYFEGEGFSDADRASLRSGSTITTSIRMQLPSALRSYAYPDPIQIWAISPPIYLEEIDHGPDRPISVKGYRDPMPAEYKYIYTEPGTHTVTFVGYNSSVYGTKEIVKQIQVTVTE